MIINFVNISILYAYRTGANRLNGVIENTEIFNRIKEIL